MDSWQVLGVLTWIRGWIVDFGVGGGWGEAVVGRDQGRRI